MKFFSENDISAINNLLLNKQNYINYKNKFYSIDLFNNELHLIVNNCLIAIIVLQNNKIDYNLLDKKLTDYYTHTINLNNRQIINKVLFNYRYDIICSVVSSFKEDIWCA